MKRLLSTALIIIMVLSLAVTAFAAASSEGAEGKKKYTFYLADGLNSNIDSIYVEQADGTKGTLAQIYGTSTSGYSGIAEIESFHAGDTFYIPVIKEDAAGKLSSVMKESELSSDGVKLKYSASKGKSYIVAPELVKEKRAGASKQVYVKVGLVEDYYKTSNTKIKFKVYLARSSSKSEELLFEGNLTVQKEEEIEEEDTFDVDGATKFEVTSSFRDPVTFSFYNDNADTEAYFTVRLKKNQKFVLYMDDTENDKLMEQYPSVDFAFFNFKSGYTFAYEGNIYFPDMDETSCVYLVDANNKLQLQKPKYSNDEDCYYLTTNKLGYYIVTSEKLGSNNKA